MTDKKAEIGQLSFRLDASIKRRFMGLVKSQGRDVKDVLLELIGTYEQRSLPSLPPGSPSEPSHRVSEENTTKASLDPALIELLHRIHKRHEKEPVLRGDLVWLERLYYILVCGDKETKDAITKNLDRFHLLTQLLEEARGIPAKLPREVPPDHKARMDRLRELGKGPGGSRGDRRDDAGRGPGKTQDDPDKTGTGSQH